MPIQCPNCTALNRDTATFCDSCGSRLVVPSEQVTPAAAIRKPETLPEEQVGPTASKRPPETLPSTPPHLPSPSVQPPKVRGALMGIVSRLREEVESENRNVSSFLRQKSRTIPIDYSMADPGSIVCASLVWLGGLIYSIRLARRVWRRK